MSEPLGPSPKPHVVGLVIFIVGMLILVPSGLCTTVFGIGFLVGGNGDGGLSMLPLVAIIGGIPVLIGAALVYLGLKLRREK